MPPDDSEGARAPGSAASRAQRLARHEPVALAAGCLATTALLFAISRFAPWISPDTGGYRDASRATDMWARARHPLFGWLLDALPDQSVGSLPILQVALFLAAAMWLHVALRRYGLSLRASGSVTLSLLLSNLLLLWHNAIHPEVLSVVLAVASLALVTDLAAGLGFAPRAALLMLALGGAYLLRPTFLPTILMVPPPLRPARPAAGRPPCPDEDFRPRGLCALPFLVNAAIRWREVGDFNIVSFGGFQMSGMAGLMLDPDLVSRLPEDTRPWRRRSWTAARPRSGGATSSPRRRTPAASARSCRRRSAITTSTPAPTIRCCTA